MKRCRNKLNKQVKENQDVGKSNSETTKPFSSEQDPGQSWTDDESCTHKNNDKETHMIIDVVWALTRLILLHQIVAGCPVQIGVSVTEPYARRE